MRTAIFIAKRRDFGYQRFEDLRDEDPPGLLCFHSGKEIWTMTCRGKRVPLVLSVLGMLGWATLLGAQGTQAGPTYAEVEPIFKKHCVACHSGAKPADGLRLDSYAQIMGHAGKHPAVVSKEPEKSEIVRRIRGVSKPRMPGNGPPWLTEEQTAVIERWIRAGAIER
jgi:mono/diheme cytochrome c family protein